MNNFSKKISVIYMKFIKKHPEVRNNSKADKFIARIIRKDMTIEEKLEYAFLKYKGVI